MEILFITFHFLSFLVINHGAFYEFIPNANQLTTRSSDSSSCAKDRIVISDEGPVALYMDSFVGINEIVFPSQSSSEIILGGDACIYGKEEGDANGCNGYFTYKNPSVTPAWHDPTVWRFLNISTNPQPPLLHSEMIPSQYDTAFFNPATNHKVVIDIPVRIGQLISGGYSHSTDTFLDHIETVEGEIQFQLSKDIEPENFIDEIIMEAFPPVHVMQKECQDRTGCVSYNLNSKIEAEICSRVSDCPSDSSIACTKAFRPRGHCCLVCGSVIKFQSSTLFDHLSVRIVINETLRMKAPEGRFSLIKTADWEYQLVLVKGRGDMDFDHKWITETTDMLKQTIVQKVNGVLEETITVLYALDRTPYDKIALGLGLFCLLSLLLGVAIVGFRKKIAITNFFIGTRIHLRALWRDDDDRIHLEMADPGSRHSIAEASMTSFENPSFKNLLAREDDKATGAAVYGSPVSTISYEDKSGITFSNPLFEGGAKSD